MFINNINPVIANIGFLEIRYYGLIYAFGFVLVYFFLKYFIKKEKLSMNEKQLDDLILYLLVGIVAGARFFNFVFYHPSIFWTNPLEILMIWHGGLSFHGGLIGAAISMTLFSRKNKIKPLVIFDALVVPSSLGLAFGRIANFTNSELYGHVSNVPWCVKFVAVDNLCRHPYQLYASISHFIMFFILLKIYWNSKKKGVTFWNFVLIYGAFRFITDFFREEIKIFGISMGQLLSLLMVIIASYILIKHNKKA